LPVLTNSITQYNIGIGMNVCSGITNVNNSIFIGSNTSCTNSITNSVCIGNNTVVSTSYTIQLGSNSEIVAFTGNLKNNGTTITTAMLNFLTNVSSGKIPSSVISDISSYALNSSLSNYQLISGMTNYVTNSNLNSNLANYLTISSASSFYQPISSMTSYANLNNVNNFSNVSNDIIFNNQYLNKLIYLTGSTTYILTPPFYSIYQVDLYSSNVFITLPPLSSISTKGMKIEFIIPNCNGHILTINRYGSDTIVSFNGLESYIPLSTITLDDTKTYISLIAYNNFDWYLSSPSLILGNYLTISSASSFYQPISSMTSYANLSNVNTFSNDNIFNNQYINKLVFLTGSTIYTLSPPFYSVYQIDVYSSNITVNLPVLSSVYKGMKIEFIIPNSNGYTLTINRYGSDTIVSYNGLETYLPLSSITLNDSKTYVSLIAYNNYDWYITSPSLTLSNYLTISSASSTYQPISSMSSYLTSASASSIYQPISGMSSYLTTSNASSIYQPIGSYLTISSASSTYQPISSMINYIDLTSTQTLSGLKLFSTIPRIGLDCLRVFQSGTNNIGYGNSSMYNFLSGNNNVCYGQSSLYAATNTTSNTCIGAGSLLSYAGSSSTIGYNSGLGYQSGWNLTIAGSNSCTFLGANSSVSSTSVSYTQSTAIGANSVIDSSNQIKMGTINETTVFPGIATFQNNINNYNNTIYFFNSAYSSTFVNYKRIFFDNTGSLTVYNQSGIGVFLSPSGTSWSANSDSRIKKNINYLSNNESDNILKLKPCTYNYISDDENQKSRIGFIAQDVETIYPNIIEVGSYSDELQDNIKAINTSDLIPYIIKAIQEQDEKISNIVISSQIEYITNLENKINTLESQLNKLTNCLKLKGII